MEPLLGRRAAREHRDTATEGRNDMKISSLIRGAATAAVVVASLAHAQERPGDYRLGPGDSIKVQVYQSPDLTVEARVNESGVVTYPLVGRVQLGGLTLTEAEGRIASALKKAQILKNPQVNINVLQVRGNQVTVLGQVQKPGRVPLETTTMRVSDVIASAGGVLPTGGEVAVVTGSRKGKPFRKEVDLSSLMAGRMGEDFVLSPGDTVFVAKAPVFYLYGEARQPGTYRVERGMTVMQAIAQGGGITPRGSQNRLKLTRKGPDGQTVELSPKLTDPIYAGDVLFIKESIF
jgi:polysaccharide export outer membrane protein